MTTTTDLDLFETGFIVATVFSFLFTLWLFGMTRKTVFSTFRIFTLPAGLALLSVLAAMHIWADYQRNKANEISPVPAFAFVLLCYSSLMLGLLIRFVADTDEMETDVKVRDVAVGDMVSFFGWSCLAFSTILRHSVVNLVAGFFVALVMTVCGSQLFKQKLQNSVTYLVGFFFVASGTSFPVFVFNYT